MLSTLILGTTSMQSLVFEATRQQRVAATQLAQSIAAETIAHIMETPAFGQQQLASETVTCTDPTGFCTAICTFCPAVAQANHVLYSTNRLQMQSSIQGSDRIILPDMLEVIGYGSIGGVQESVEILIHMPPFDFALASSGPLRSPQGGLLVGGVSNNAQAAGGNFATNVNQLGPGNMVSNSTLSNSMVLGPMTLVTGNARASGGIQISRNAVVRGDVLSNYEPEALPTIDLSKFNPIGQKPVVVALASSSSDLSLEGYSAANNGLTINGNLTLDSGVLYVNGDLVVHGGIQGKGAIIVNGQTVLDGGADLSTSNQAVLLSSGDVTMSSTSHKAFQGVVYTQGNFTADNISVVGAFVANKPDSGGSSSVVNNAQLIQYPGYQNLKLDVNMVLPPSGSGTSMYYLMPNGTCGILYVRPDPSGQGFDFNDGSGSGWWPSSSPGRDGAQAISHYSRALNVNQQTQFITDITRTGGTQTNNLSNLLPAPNPSATPHVPPVTVTTNTGTQTTTLSDTWSFNLNDFISFADRLRVMFWRAQ
jgi:cytoskeletal protein CcmA (bactofilin family)